VRLYSASSEETLRARQLLKEWRDDGFLTEVQYERLEKETVSDLRTTNLFLRLALFFFTLISVAASAGLWFAVFVSRPSQQTTGAFLLIFAVACYAAAEVAGSRLRLYRYGIEEALTVCSVAFLCAGMQAAFFSSILYSPHPDASQFLVPAAGAVFSLWIWHRFGLWYAFPAAMIFLIFLPNYSSFSHAAQHLTVAVFYASGLLCVAVARSRHHFDYLEKVYSLAEAFLWFGIYLAINLQISSLDLPARQWGGNRLSIWKAVLLDHVGADLVPTAPRARARRSPEKPSRDRRRFDRGRAHPHLQQAISRLAAAYLGSYAPRRIVDRRCGFRSALARPWPG
jgi:hypothetical protein